MERVVQSVSSTFPLIALLCASVILGVTGAQAQNRALSPGQITESSVIEALEAPAGTSGKASASDPEIQTRGFRVMAPAPSDAAGGGGAVVAPARKLPMLLTFNTDSAELLPQTKAVLDRVAAGLKSERLASESFLIEGHADPRGSEEHNLRLSEARAESVLRYLVTAHGLSPDRFTAIGKGTSDLLNRENTSAPENRRVSLVVRP